MFFKMHCLFSRRGSRALCKNFTKVPYEEMPLGALNNIDFFYNTQWSGSSPDLNATENLGVILKKCVGDRIVIIPSMERNLVENLQSIISEELTKIKEKPEIFVNLLKSYPVRLDAVKKKDHTDY